MRFFISYFFLCEYIYIHTHTHTHTQTKLFIGSGRGGVWGWTASLIRDIPAPEFCATAVISATIRAWCRSAIVPPYKRAVCARKRSSWYKFSDLKKEKN